MKKILTIALITLFVSCSSTPYRESTGQYIDNSGITAKIKSKMIADSKIGSTSIDIETYKGIVVVSGFVDTREEKLAILKIAEGTKGVKEVKHAIYLRSDYTE